MEDDVEVAELLEFEDEDELLEDDDELDEEAVLPDALALAFALELADAVLVADPVPVVDVEDEELEELVVLAVVVAGPPFEALELDALAEEDEPALAAAEADPESPEFALVFDELEDPVLVEADELLALSSPELVAEAVPEASAEPVAEPEAEAPWPEAVEEDDVFVEEVELLVDVVEPESSEDDAELLELEEEELLEDEPELEEDVSANTASGEATITKTSAETRAF